MDRVLNKDTLETLLLMLLEFLRDQEAFGTWTRQGMFHRLWVSAGIPTTKRYSNAYMRDSKKDTDFLDSGRRRGWDDLREQHWNMYITICEIDDQSKFDAWHSKVHKALKASALGWPRGMGWEGSERGVRGGVGGHMYTHGWFMSMYGKKHYNIVISLQLK